MFINVKDDDYKSYASLSRRLLELFIFDINYEKNVSILAKDVLLNMSSHPFDVMIRKDIIDNYFTFSVIYFTYLKAGIN